MRRLTKEWSATQPPFTCSKLTTIVNFEHVIAVWVCMNEEFGIHKSECLKIEKSGKYLKVTF